VTAAQPRSGVYNRRRDTQAQIDAAELRNSDAVWSALDHWYQLEVLAGELAAAVAGHDVALVELALARCSSEAAQLRLVRAHLKGDVKAADKLAREVVRWWDRVNQLEKAR
jgi:hypothetical protein